jgi:hypothetical protein
VAKAPHRKLKVFQAQFGFHDSVVAAPSQAAALRAWGVRQNLFAEGQARITDDAQAVEAARAHPETPLRRVVGSGKPFKLEPTGQPAVPTSAKRAGRAAARKPPPDRAKLSAAEAALQAIDETHKRQDADLRSRLARLREESANLQAAYATERKTATTALVRARQAYRKAGGKD